jgi:hypothetical protein
MDEIIFFVLGLLFLALKVKGGVPKKMISTMLIIPIIKLKNSKCGQGKKIYFQPPTFGAKNKRPRPKKIDLGHA